MCNNGIFKIMPIYQSINTDILFKEMKGKELINILNPDLNAN